MQELQKNKKLTKKQQRKNGGDFFRDRLHQVFETDDTEKNAFLTILANEAKKYLRLKKRRENEQETDRIVNSGQRGSMLIHTDIKNLDDIQYHATRQAKLLVPVENMINPHLVSQLNRQKTKQLSEIHKARIGASAEDDSDCSDSEESPKNAKDDKKKEFNVNSMTRSQTSHVIKGEHDGSIASRSRKRLGLTGRRQSAFCQGNVKGEPGISRFGEHRKSIFIVRAGTKGSRHEKIPDGDCWKESDKLDVQQDQDMDRNGSDGGLDDRAHSEAIDDYDLPDESKVNNEFNLQYTDQTPTNESPTKEPPLYSDDEFPAKKPKKKPTTNDDPDNKRDKPRKVPGLTQSLAFAKRDVTPSLGPSHQGPQKFHAGEFIKKMIGQTRGNQQPAATNNSVGQTHGSQKPPITNNSGFRNYAKRDNKFFWKVFGRFLTQKIENFNQKDSSFDCKNIFENFGGGIGVGLEGLVGEAQRVRGGLRLLLDNLEGF